MSGGFRDGGVGAGLLLLLGGCAGLTHPAPSSQDRLESSLAPREAAWLAAQVLSRQVPTPAGDRPAPALREGAGGFRLEARARPGALYRFRSGGGFAPEPPPPAPDPAWKELPLEELLGRVPPAAPGAGEWEDRSGAPFPLFYDRFLVLSIQPRGEANSTLELAWADGEEPVGARVVAGLRRALGTMEPLVQGIELLRQGDAAAALTALDRALAGGSPPSSPFEADLLARIHLNRGLCLARLGGLEESWRAFADARRLAPEDALARALEGLLALRTGRCAAAREAFGGPQAAGTLARFLQERGRQELAAATPDPAGEARRLLARAVALLDAGREREARTLLLVARCHRPLGAPATAELARAARLRRDGPDGRRQLCLALAKTPGDRGLLASLADLETEAGFPGLALHLAAPLGLDHPAARAALAALDPEERAARLVLAGPGRAPDLTGESPLGRTLLALRDGTPLTGIDAPAAAPPR